MSYINIDQSNIDKEHICCAISEKQEYTCHDALAGDHHIRRGGGRGSNT